MATAIEPTTTNQDHDHDDGSRDVRFPANYFWQAVRAVAPMADSGTMKRYSLDCLTIFQSRGQWYIGATDGRMMAIFQLGPVDDGEDLPSHRRNQLLLSPKDMEHLRKHSSRKGSARMTVVYDRNEPNALATARIVYTDKSGELCEYRPRGEGSMPLFDDILRGNSFWFGSKNEEPTHVFEIQASAPESTRNLDFTDYCVKIPDIVLDKAANSWLQLETIPVRKQTDWKLRSWSDEAEIEERHLLPLLDPALLARARKGIPSSRLPGTELRVRGVNRARESRNDNPLVMVGFSGKLRVIIMPRCDK